jgi:hypothetical protein
MRALEQPHICIYRHIYLNYIQVECELRVVTLQKKLDAAELKAPVSMQSVFGIYRTCTRHNFKIMARRQAGLKQNCRPEATSWPLR